MSSIRRVPQNAVSNIDRYLLNDGDILFNATNSPNLVGKTARFVDQGEPFVFSNHFVRLAVNPDRLDSSYLARWLTLQQQRGVFELLCTRWVNQASVRKEDLLSQNIPFPPLAEQKRIAAILDQADALRAKRRAALARLDALVQSVFLEMFGDPVTNPMGWEVGKLEQVGTLERGKSKHRPRNAPELLNGPYPLVQTGDIANAEGGYLTSYSQTYSEIGLKQSRMWKAGVLCITIAANIAETAITTFDACFPDSVVGFIPNSNVRTEYVQRWLSFLKKILEENAPQVAQKNINLQVLRELAIPIPPIQYQEQFVQRIEQIRFMRRSHKQYLQACDNFFFSLQQRAFRGEL